MLSMISAFNREKDSKRLQKAEKIISARKWDKRGGPSYTLEKVFEIVYEKEWERISSSPVGNGRDFSTWDIKTLEKNLVGLL